MGELDFVIEYKGSIYPIEVKSGKDYTVHSAISNCVANHQYEMQEAFVFADCNIKHDKKITYLPIYMVMFLEKDQSEDFIVDEVLFLIFPKIKTTNPEQSGTVVFIALSFFFVINKNFISKFTAHLVSGLSLLNCIKDN